MRVTVLGGAGAGGAGARTGTAHRAPTCSGPWRPALTLGAVSAGGLMLPDAHPTATTLYGPRAVWIDPERVIAADTGNHRVLIWHGQPNVDGAPADVVLGQGDATSEGPQRGCGDTLAGMNLPTGILVDRGRLLVADAWNHRLLLWDRIPTRTGTPPDHVIGQPAADAIECNRGGAVGPTGFYWPFGIALIDGRLYVADTGNRRVLVWSDGIPVDGVAADLVLGQDDFGQREENRGGPAGACSFRWPHAICATGEGGIFVADAGDHRVLRWDRHPDGDVPADGVIGQPDFTSSSEFPYQPQRGRLRFPYGACGPGLALADTANNRVLIWDHAPRGVRRDSLPGPARWPTPSGSAEPAARAYPVVPSLADPAAAWPLACEPPDWVLAQPDFDAAGENRWQAVAPDTLCWPYGIGRDGDRLAVADSGNNRVTIWRREESD